MPLSAKITVKEVFLSACERNDLATVRALLPIGADADWKKDDGIGSAGLHFAAAENYMGLLELLLAHGADVNIKDKNMGTPLMVACYSGHENIARRLSQVPGVEVNARDYNGRTALYHAVIRVTPACVSVLRGVAGVDWNIRTNYGYNPLTLAVEGGLGDILQILLSVPHPHLDLHVTDCRGRNIAQIAVEGNNQRCLELLSRDRRVDWNRKNGDGHDGDTPLIFCLKNDQIKMARCLINTPGVDLDISDSNGHYPETIARLVNRLLNARGSFGFIFKGIGIRERSWA